MTLWNHGRRLALAAIGACLFAAAPASAQFFWKPADLAGAPVKGDEPDIGIALPGANPTEYRAALLWHLRAALNVAALQCQFEPTLLTLGNYNSMLTEHGAELGSAYKTLGDYFVRTQGKRGQGAFDQYNTRLYLGFSTVGAQLNFCQTAGSVGREAIFQPRGTLYQVAEKRMRELRNSLVRHGDLAFGNPTYGYQADLPSLDDKCWKKGKLLDNCRDEWEGRLKLAAQTQGRVQPIP